jgi:hypothetical protein
MDRGGLYAVLVIPSDFTASLLNVSGLPAAGGRRHRPAGNDPGQPVGRHRRHPAGHRGLAARSGGGLRPDRPAPDRPDPRRVRSPATPGCCWPAPHRGDHPVPSPAGEQRPGAQCLSASPGGACEDGSKANGVTWRKVYLDAMCKGKAVNLT